MAPAEQLAIDKAMARYDNHAEKSLASGADTKGDVRESQRANMSLQLEHLEPRRTWRRCRL